LAAVAALEGVMEQGEILLEELSPPIAWLTLNRPANRNAMTLTLWKRLAAAMRRLAGEESVRVIILTGAGEQAFSAGADIMEIDHIRQSSERITAYLEAVEEVMRAIQEAPQPVIAMVNGPAVGGGCEIAAACDLRLASVRARLGIPARNLGIVIMLSDMRRLTALVGIGRAKELLMTGRMVSADEALSMGLVNRVVSPEQLRPECEALALDMSSKAPETLRSAKIMGNWIVSSEATADPNETFKLSIEGWHSENFAEGVRAYIEGRVPIFRNR
jgi:enoyl-CoA hydratase/carnithine racemase